MEKNTRENLQIFCVNDGKRHTIEAGSTLLEASRKWCRTVRDERSGNELPVLAALVDQKIKDLNFRNYNPHRVEFVTYANPEGRRCYIRSLCFVLQKAVSELYPDKVLLVEHSLPSGLYCEIADIDPETGKRCGIHFLKDEEVDALKTRMQELIDADLPFTSGKLMAEDADKLFLSHHQADKSRLLNSLGLYTTVIYYLDGLGDTFHGPLATSTGFLKVFDLSAFSSGLCLQLPLISNFNKIMPMRRQSKIAGSLEEYNQWCQVIGIHGLGSLNTAIDMGKAVDIINISESLHERKYAMIADMIWQRRDKVKIVFIAGPSSSGKTSSSLRIALQCKVLGLNPKVIELDNYFRDRDDTPLDENGEKDFESLGAMDLDCLNSQLNDLLDGKEVEVPRYDFKEGRRVWSGNRLKLEKDDILIMEGIHALNPDMTPGVDNSRIFRVYASALTSLHLDENNNISTSDNRLLRRMVRDNRVRGISPESTIMRWPSVRRGEVRNIFPFQENADVIFNSALVFELPLLRYYAEPLLRRIAPNSEAYPEAARMLKFLSFIKPLQPSEIAAIPPTSIMREFIGGQTL